MKYTGIILLCLFLMMGCSGDKPPKDLLSKDEMVNILVDIHMVEGLVGALPIPYDSAKRMYPKLEHEVFEKHGVPDSVFVRSMQYYVKDNHVMERIYSRVIDTLVIKEKTIDEEGKNAISE